MTGRTATGHARARITANATATSHAGNTLAALAKLFNPEERTRAAIAIANAIQSVHQYNIPQAASASGIATPSAIVASSLVTVDAVPEGTGAASHSPINHVTPKNPKTTLRGSFA